MVLNRIKQFIDYKGIAISAFEKSIGMSNASLGKSLKTGGTIGADKLGNILTAYPEINLYWLVTGKGEMLTQPPMVLPDPESASVAGGSTIDRLLLLLEEKERNNTALLQILREKDETIKRLAVEIAALKEKGETAPSADGSFVANAG